MPSFAHINCFPFLQVSGGGKLYIEGGFETLAFVVKIDDNGEVKGQGQFHKHTSDSWFSHWVPYCLSVDGNMAWIGFNTIRTTYPDLDPSWYDATVQLEILDQGTRISLVIPTIFLPGADDCNDQPDLFSIQSNVWQKGNFKIH